MIENVKVKKRERFASTITVVSGDSVQLTYDDGISHRVLLDQPITEAHVFDEGVIFEGEVDGRYALGGAFVEQEANK